MAVEDDKARREWFRREILPLEPALYAQARRLCRRRPDDAEDLVQDVLAKLIVLENWREVDNVGAFAARTMRNLVLQAVRRSKVVAIDAVADLDDLGLAQDDPDPETIMVGRDELRVLAILIGELPPQCRRVFTLRKAYGLSHQQIAVSLGLSISTVEKHVAKGLHYCAEQLARRSVGEAGAGSGRSWSVSRDRSKRR